MLNESFEAADFMAVNGWSLLSGAPTPSNAAAYDGFYSLPMDSSYPLISKTFPAPYFTWCAGYFLDDATQTASTYKPFIQWISTAAGVYGLGVDNSVSTGFYTVVKLGLSFPTTIARTTGWHRLEIKNTGSAIDFFIDGISAGVGVGAVTMQTVKVGAAVAAGAPAFGAFDLIQIAYSHRLTVNRLTDGQAVKLYQSSGTLIGSATAAGGQVQIDPTAINQPFDGYMTITRPDGLRPFFYGPTLSLAAGDSWGLETFDLGRRVASFQLERETRRDDKEATSGKDESLFYYARDKVSLTFSDLTNDQRLALERWWGLAEDGSVFSVAIDSDDTYKNTLAADAISAPSSVTANSSVGVNRKSKIRLRRSNGLTSEAAQIATVAGAVLNLTVSLLQEYLAGDEIRHAYFWPSAKTLDKSFKPTLTNAKLKRWAATISFKEAY